MKQRDPWFIWGQEGDRPTMLKRSSVRQGRALRAASAIARYTQSKVFISKAETCEDLARLQDRVYA